MSAATDLIDDRARNLDAQLRALDTRADRIPADVLRHFALVLGDMELAYLDLSIAIDPDHMGFRGMVVALNAAGSYFEVEFRGDMSTRSVVVAPWRGHVVKVEVKPDRELIADGRVPTNALAVTLDDEVTRMLPMTGRPDGPAFIRKVLDALAL